MRAGGTGPHLSREPQLGNGHRIRCAERGGERRTRSGPGHPVPWLRIGVTLAASPSLGLLSRRLFLSTRLQTSQPNWKKKQAPETPKVNSPEPTPEVPPRASALTETTVFIGRAPTRWAVPSGQCSSHSAKRSGSRAAEMAVEISGSKVQSFVVQRLSLLIGLDFKFPCAAGSPVFPFLERLKDHLERLNKAVSSVWSSYPFPNSPAKGAPNVEHLLMKQSIPDVWEKARQLLVLGATYIFISVSQSVFALLSPGEKPPQLQAIFMSLVGPSWQLLGSNISLDWKNASKNGSFAP